MNRLQQFHTDEDGFVVSSELILIATILVVALVVGLGTTASIEAVKVRWPDGKEESFTGTLADKYWRLTQGEGQAVAVGGR